MSGTSHQKFVLGTAMVAAFIAAGTAATSEVSVGSTVESRVLLGFKVDNAAVAGMLPEGWSPITLGKGPVAGSNLIIALIDRHLILDADGEPGNPSSGPTVAFLSYGRSEGVEGVRGFVTRVYEEAPVVDPYKTSVTANIDRVASFSDLGNGDRVQSERWTILPAGGGELRFELDFSLGDYRWTTAGESRPHSPEDPEFFRIYRFDQLASLAMNTNMGLELNGTVSFTASDPDLGAMFGGSEELVSIVSIPIYLRKISLP